MLWKVDATLPTPLHAQVAASVRGAIADGSVRTGERLPSARDVAESLDMNLHTVLRAYQALRDEGLIELRRGRGAVVIADDPGHARLAGLVGDLLAEAGRLGMARADVIRLIEEKP
ncbi:GntR family transcriptional regulator [Mariniluteicoccus flavus]